MMKPAQIRWNCEEQFRYKLMVDQVLHSDTREIASYSIDATPSPRHHRRNCLLLASHGGGIAVLGVRIKTPFLYPKSSNPLKWLPLRHPKSGNPLKWLPLRHPKSGNPLL